jgi:hypothetical protein
MSQENVEKVKRTIQAANRRDIEALLEEVDAEAQWPHPGFTSRWVGRRPCIEGTKVSARCCGDRGDGALASEAGHPGSCGPAGVDVALLSKAAATTKAPAPQQRRSRPADLARALAKVKLSATVRSFGSLRS